LQFGRRVAKATSRATPRPMEPVGIRCWRNAALWWRCSVVQLSWIVVPFLLVAHIVGLVLGPPLGAAMAFLFKRPEGEGQDPVAKQHAKLKGYYELVQDILSRAAANHNSQQQHDAIRLYQVLPPFL